MTQLSPPTARKVSSHWPLISGVSAVALVIALGVLIAVRTTPLGVDAEWMEEVVENRNAFLEVPALILNYIGGGWISVFLVPIGGAVALYFIRGRWTALYYLAVMAISGGVVQLLKTVIGRERPEDFLLVIGSPSFPSGHSANAATLAVTLALIIGRWWVWAIGALYTLMMALSRTYLGVHWATDTIAGALLGAGIAFILWAPFAARLKREWSAKHPQESAQQTVDAAKPDPR